MGGPFYPASAPPMPDDFWDELAAENPLATDKITAQDAQDWFYLVAWLKYKTYPYGPSRDRQTHRQKILRWWAGIEGQDILDARHRRAVKEGRAKPKRYRRPQPGSRELPQERRGPGSDIELGAVLRAIQGGEK